MTMLTDSAAAAKAEIERVERAASALSPLEREVLVLTAGRRFSVADVAGHFGISEFRAERLLARALRKFDCALVRGDRPWWRLWRPGP